MRTVAQISDLHFGAILEPTLDVLVEHLHALAPQLTIISGDLTQRASREQFLGARAYLQRLPTPQLVIPGNHDVPLYNVFRRFLAPFGEYDACISPEHCPSYIDNEIAVVALNSARAFTFKGGHLTPAAVRQGVAHFARATNGQVRLFVTHHPFDIPVGLSGVSIVGGARAAVQSFAACEVDVYLTGHLHLVHHARASLFVPGYDATMLVAGTATSTRARGETNSFYLFRIDHTRRDDAAIVIETHSWNAARNLFEVTDTRSLPRVSRATAAG